MSHIHYAATPIEVVELKAQPGSAGEFSAYASTFGNRDHGGDIIEKGAFAASLKARKFRPLLWQHDMREPIGLEKSLREDGKGLLGTWQLVDTQRGRDAYALLKAGAVRSMSIGYIPTKWEFEQENSADVTRVLKEIDLLENSVVSIPMNDQAQVQSVKHGTSDHCEYCADLRALDDELKAEWSTSFINNLPDSAFAFIESGGEKDSEGKTTPRSLRHFPHHGTGGGVDLPHLRNALARAPQSPFGDRAMPHLRRHASAEGVGKSDEEHTHDDIELTFSEQARMLAEQASAFGERTAELLAKLESGGHELTGSKREDLTALLETFSGLDAVRHQAEALVERAKPVDSDSKGYMALALEMSRHRLRQRGIEV